MIELHYFPGNASMAPHIVLRELQLPFTLRLVDRGQMAHKQPDYLALNPNGLIPVLRDGTLVLFEAAAICLHLADRAALAGAATADAGLLPPLGSDARAQAYKWLMWLSNTLQATLITYFYPERLVDDGNSAGAAQVKAHAQLRIGGLLAQIEAQLAGHGQPWLLGAQYSVADAYAFMLCRWTRGFEGAATPPARTRPAIRAWLDRMLARPAVQQTIAAEGLPQPWV
jgi:glutathione S-transferase